MQGFERMDAAAHTCSYRVLSWLIMSGNWVTSGRSPG